MARSLGADDAGHHRHVVADHVMEIERGLGLVDQRGDMADVDRLVQVDELAVLPQAVEELAEVFLHPWLRLRWVVVGRGAKLLRPFAIVIIRLRESG